MNLLNTWWFNIILYLLLVVTYNQTYKICTKSAKKDGALMVVIQFLSGIIILLAIPFFNIQFPTDYTVYLLLGVSIIFYAITDRLNATARRGLEVSTFGIIQQLSTVFVITWGLLFFKEPFIISKIAGAILIILSNIFLLYQKGKITFNKYIVLQIMACISLSIASCIDIGISDQFNLPIYVACTLLIPGILITIFDRVKWQELKTEFQTGNKKAILVTSAIWGIMIIFNLRAYQLGNISTVAPIAALSVILNVIAGYIFLKERDKLCKKIIAAILILISIAFIQM